MRNRVGGDSRVVVKAENVLALGGTEADVQRFREAEVFGEAAVAYPGKFLIERRRAVGRAAIDDDYLKSFIQHFEALAKLLNAVEGDDYD